MSLTIPPGYALAALKFSLSGDPEMMVTTFGVDLEAPYTGDMAGAQAVYEKWRTAFPVLTLSSSYAYNGCKLFVGQDGGPPAIYDYVTSEQGGVVLSNLPQNCSIHVRKATALGGRRGRGRMFLPPMYLNENAVTATGIIDESNRVGIQDRCATFLTGLPMVLLHSDVPEVADPAPTPVTALTVDPRISTTRRRLR